MATDPHRRMSLPSLATSIILATPLLATDVFTLGFRGPEALHGTRGDAVHGEYLVTLHQHTTPQTRSGAQGWQFSATADNATIIAISTDGTHGGPDTIPPGIFHAGFQSSFLMTSAVAGSDCDGKNSVQSATILSFVWPDLTLDPAEDSTLARLNVEAWVPSSGEGSALLRFAEGCRSQGAPPAENVVVQDADGIAPQVETQAVALRGDAITFRRGDSNADAAVDLSDALTVLGYLFLGSPAVLPCTKSADADDTGSVTISDAVRLLDFLFIGTSPLPAPHSECGLDPTEDALSCASYSPCGYAQEVYLFDFGLPRLDARLEWYVPVEGSLGEVSDGQFHVRLPEGDYDCWWDADRGPRLRFRDDLLDRDFDVETQVTVDEPAGPDCHEVGIVVEFETPPGWEMSAWFFALHSYPEWQGGPALLAERSGRGDPTSAMHELPWRRPTAQIKVERRADTYTFLCRENGTQEWTHVHSAVSADAAVRSVGLFAKNWGTLHAVRGRFEYLRIAGVD